MAANYFHSTGPKLLLLHVVVSNTPTGSCVVWVLLLLLFLGNPYFCSRPYSAATGGRDLMPVPQTDEYLTR